MLRPMARGLALALLVVVAACDANGNSLTYPGASVYQSPAKDFHFHFLEPPWRPDTPEAGVLAHLAADSSGPIIPGTKPVTHELRVTYGAGASAQAAAAAEQASEVTAGRTITTQATKLTTLTGEEGWDVQSLKDLPAGRAYYRETFFQATGKVVRFSLVAAYATDSLDVNDLFLSFSLGPDPGGPTPTRVRDGGI